jgi:alpha-mannosidase
MQVRLVAMSQQPTTAVVTGPFGSAVRTDLLGRPLEDLSVDDGRLSVDLSPWEIVTMCLNG